MALAGVGAVGLVSWANSTKSTAEAAEAQTAVVIVDKLVPTGADADTIKAATHVGTVQQKASSRARSPARIRSVPRWPRATCSRVTSW